MEMKKQPKSEAPGPVRVIRIVMDKDGVNVKYPKVVGMRNKQAEASMNKAMLALSRQMTSSLKKEAEAAVEGRYDIVFNDRGLLSVLFEQFPTGAKNERMIRRSLTFQTDTGSILMFRNLFKEGSYYKTKLSRLVREEIKEKAMTLPDDFTGVKDDQEYYLTSEGIVIFDGGCREFIFPYSGSVQLLASGPLAGFTEESVTKVKRL
ncbi:DUF3298 and DUF4163 domain-containing protein [Bacillus marinisedimentorum]|uniref:DUF3298 and DUF4163 domain-containing protein n=1 Tax=Bacillus marinisedimentorum TaxID=1821260 RepID=UPI00087277A5|nr:DUF3298 and DUF4163 domain-containing protein [Bacillus marinisedimentorum]